MCEVVPPAAINQVLGLQYGLHPSGQQVSAVHSSSHTRAGLIASLWYHGWSCGVSLFLQPMVPHHSAPHTMLQERFTVVVTGKFHLLHSGSFSNAYRNQ